MHENATRKTREGKWKHLDRQRWGKMSRDIAPEADTKYFNEQRATWTASI